MYSKKLTFGFPILLYHTPSPDREPFEIHKLLLENGVLIAENLTNMDKLISAKQFEVIALPLNIRADSSPTRIVAKILE